jgi:ribonuclease HI
MKFRAHVDGAARGNPGPAGAGVYVHAEDGLPAEEHFEALGRATNNVAEYRALLLALDRAQRRGANRRDDRVGQPPARRADARQIPSEGGAPAAAGRRRAAPREVLPRFSIRHVRREQNVDADRLANLGADESERLMAGGTLASGTLTPNE